MQNSNGSRSKDPRVKRQDDGQDFDSTLAWEPFLWPVLIFRKIFGSHPTLEKALSYILIAIALYVAYLTLTGTEWKWPIEFNVEVK